MVTPLGFSPIGDFGVSNDLNCSGDLNRDSCILTQNEIAKRDAIAIVRSILSALSFGYSAWCTAGIMGTFSIIVSVILKKQIFSPKVHPIFMLSIADFILGILWTVGGGLWLSEGYHRYRNGCFAILLTTVIMECVAVNLTCVYAWLAYANIKRRDFSNTYSLFKKDYSKRIGKPWKTILIYLIAWTLPILIVLASFFGIDAQYGLTKNVDKCTCWCLPFFGNVLPHANPLDAPTRAYLGRLRHFILAYSIVVEIHYVIGFIVLVIVYWKVLARIKHVRKIHEETNSHNLYGTTEAILVKGQSQARIRVVSFLTVFVISGFFNVILSTMVIHYSINKVQGHRKLHAIPLYGLVTYILQSITLPLQGFLNAIVYGWTREDFIQAIAINTQGESVASARPPGNSTYRQQSPIFASSPPHHSNYTTDIISRKTEKALIDTLSESNDSD